MLPRPLNPLRATGSGLGHAPPAAHLGSHRSLDPESISVPASSPTATFCHNLPGSLLRWLIRQPAFATGPPSILTGSSIVKDSSPLHSPLTSSHRASPTGDPVSHIMVSSLWGPHDQNCPSGAALCICCRSHWQNTTCLQAPCRLHTHHSGQCSGGGRHAHRACLSHTGTGHSPMCAHINIPSAGHFPSPIRIWDN